MSLTVTEPNVWTVHMGKKPNETHAKGGNTHRARYAAANSPVKRSTLDVSPGIRKCPRSFLRAVSEACEHDVGSLKPRREIIPRLRSKTQTLLSQQVKP